jgi:hypothetical protein
MTRTPILHEKFGIRAFFCVRYFFCLRLEFWNKVAIVTGRESLENQGMPIWFSVSPWDGFSCGNTHSLGLQIVWHQLSEKVIVVFFKIRRNLT